MDVLVTRSNSAESQSPPVIRNLADLRADVADWKRAGQSVGVVPTMGALHDGHLSLVRKARQSSDRVIVTIFVNPKQFENSTDLKSYPRTEETDARRLAAIGVDAIYAPDSDQIYPEGFSTNISVGGVSEGLCGAGRAGHFDGVATVVAKLFLQTQADCAFFGEKDYQQLQVVKRLVADLDIPIRITGCPTVREKDGLAMSSRNVRLSVRERSVAPALYRVLCETAGMLVDGQETASVLAQGCDLLRSAGFSRVEYLELRHAASLAPLETLAPRARLLAAVHLGEVRLIDNIDVGQTG